MTRLSDIIRDKFPSKKIVIVGDLVADQFLHGTIARVSREAPVFILRHNETETLPGGAANAAVNVASLGGKAVLVGLTGNDANGDALLERLRNSNVECRYVISSDEYRTTTKVRVLAGQHYAPRQQVIRIDYENTETIDIRLKNCLKENFLAAAQDSNAIIISDYNYGVATAEIMEVAKRVSADKKIPLIVDSRFALKNFRGATTATPNQEEVEQILGENFTEADCVNLCKNLSYEALLITRGNKGMLLIEKNNTPFHLEAVGAKEPVDVTGAGDTVIAAYALALASDLSFSEAANLANHAGGIVVMKKGTASVSSEELLTSVSKNVQEEHKTQTL
ncbi:MAG TPA: PfkB family carbohydrate kinase [Pyrinomonadaceae bacterium]|nr:PfkB family carbohydrate kinase [Pyrinomonadaceae bacterium]